MEVGRAGRRGPPRCTDAPNRAGSAGPCRPPAPPPPARPPPAPAPGRASAAPPSRPGTAPPPAAGRRRPARAGRSRSSSAPSRVGVQPPTNRGRRHEAPGATTRQEFGPLVSHHHVAAVHVERRADEEGPLLGGEQECRRRALPGPAETADRQLLDLHLEPL